MLLFLLAGLLIGLELAYRSQTLEPPLAADVQRPARAGVPSQASVRSDNSANDGAAASPGGEPPAARDDVEASTESPRDEAEGRAPVPDAPIREWPFTPKIMESILINEIAQVPGLAASSDISADCSATICEIRYNTTSRYPSVIGADRHFRDTFEGPPYDAKFGFSARRLDSEPEEYETTLTLRSSPRPPPTAEERTEIGQRSAEITRDIARTYLPSDSYDASPVVFGKQDGADKLVENVCSYDCPRDTRRMIYLDVPDGRTCGELGGTEQTLTARMRTGAFEERTFCVPDYLIED
jgi:hypothetical protein